MTIRLLVGMQLDGAVRAAGYETNTPAAEEQALYVSRGAAEWVGSNLVGGWQNVPATVRLAISGTGTVIVDTRSRSGDVTLAAYTYSVSGAVDEVYWPYPGDDGVEIRCTHPDTVTVQILR